MEQYSIDEIFLDIHGIDCCINFEDFCQQLREQVCSDTGLTIGGTREKSLRISAKASLIRAPMFHSVASNILRCGTALTSRASSYFSSSSLARAIWLKASATG